MQPTLFQEILQRRWQDCTRALYSKHFTNMARARKGTVALTRTQATQTFNLGAGLPCAAPLPMELGRSPCVVGAESFLVVESLFCLVFVAESFIIPF